MKSIEALRVLADVTASQWGMVTSAQAGALGVTRLALSRLAEAGHLERLAHGVYKDAGAPSDEFEDLRAAWLSTDPKTLGERRLRNLADGVVVAGASAALLHGIGDLWADRHEFVSPERRQTQRTEIRYRRRMLDVRDVTLAHGLPAMTIERTIADLLGDIGEFSLVADALGTAVRRQRLDLERLRELLAPLAERNGFRRHDGRAVLDKLFEEADLDPDAVARRVAADPVLGVRIATNYLAGFDPASFAGLGVLTDMRETVRKALEPLVEVLRASIAPQLVDMNRVTNPAISDLLASGVLDRFGSLAADIAKAPAPTSFTAQRAEALPVRTAPPVEHDEAPGDQEIPHDD